MFELLAKIVFRVKCGNDNGTGFMINSQLALTVFHNIKGYENSEIEIFFNNDSTPVIATIDESITEDFKKLDIALLKLPDDIMIENFIPIIDLEISIGDLWIARGFPAAKFTTGENLNSDLNKINQVLSDLQKNKIDLHLDFDQKLSSYQGISGSPVLINNSIVGIINSELNEYGETKELEALSVKYFKQLIIDKGIEVPKIDKNDISINSDSSGTELWGSIKLSDIRNIQDKLNDVCPTFNPLKTQKYCREIAYGQTELKRFNQRDVAAMKFRIFDKCQDELIAFVENKKEVFLSPEEIETLIIDFTIRAESIIDERSKNYKYPLNNRDTLRMIVLDLIDECYLSFDKKGIYE